jgi:hypothetical protein
MFHMTGKDSRPWHHQVVEPLLPLIEVASPLSTTLVLTTSPTWSMVSCMAADLNGTFGTSKADGNCNYWLSAAQQTYRFVPKPCSQATRQVLLVLKLINALLKASNILSRLWTTQSMQQNNICNANGHVQMRLTFVFDLEHCLIATVHWLSMDVWILSRHVSKAWIWQSHTHLSCVDTSSDIMHIWNNLCAFAGWLRCVDVHMPMDTLKQPCWVLLSDNK